MKSLLSDINNIGLRLQHRYDISAQVGLRARLTRVRIEGLGCTSMYKLLFEARAFYKRGRHHHSSPPRVTNRPERKIETPRIQSKIENCSLLRPAMLAVEVVSHHSSSSTQHWTASKLV